MPLTESSYSAPPWLRNGHVLTLFPVFFRNVPDVVGQRVRLDTFDGDFIDVDMWLASSSAEGGQASARHLVNAGQAAQADTAGASIQASWAEPASQAAQPAPARDVTQLHFRGADAGTDFRGTDVSGELRGSVFRDAGAGAGGCADGGAVPQSAATGADFLRGRARRIAILTHGLEGNSHRKYMRGMGRALLRRGWDVAARNIRGCSGAMPRTPVQYHMGATEDLHTVVEYCRGQGYTTIALVGFSMGGSQTLKYMAEDPARVPAEVKAAVGISVPCDLVASAERLAAPACRIYMEYFLRTLRVKMRAAARVYPDFPSVEGLDAMRTFDEFDARFTAPINGFASARDYWQRNGCGQFLHRLERPCLLINAQDDPFMNAPCYPVAVAQRSAFLHLEMPHHGGHVGFVSAGVEYWSETRTATFLQEFCH